MHTSAKQKYAGTARMVPLPGSASTSGWLAAIALFFFTCLAYAQEEGQAASAPAETVHIGWVIAFLVVFFGMIVGYFAFIWFYDRKKNKAKEMEAGNREPPVS